MYADTKPAYEHTIQLPKNSLGAKYNPSIDLPHFTKENCVSSKKIPIVISA